MNYDQMKDERRPFLVDGKSLLPNGKESPLKAHLTSDEWKTADAVALSEMLFAAPNYSRLLAHRYLDLVLQIDGLERTTFQFDQPLPPAGTPSEEVISSFHSLPLPFVGCDIKVDAKTRYQDFLLDVADAAQQIGEKLEETLAEVMGRTLYSTSKHPREAECEAKSTAGAKAILERNRFYGPYAHFRLSTGWRALVQMTPDAIRLVIGMPLTLLQWEENLFKLVTIMVPSIHSNCEGNCGIVFLQGRK